MILPKKNFGSKDQNKAELKNLDNFDVLIDLIGLRSLTGLCNLYNPIYSKNFLVLMIWSYLPPKWPILTPFCGINHKKSVWGKYFLGSFKFA